MPPIHPFRAWMTALLILALILPTACAPGQAQTSPPHPAETQTQGSATPPEKPTASIPPATVLPATSTPSPTPTPEPAPEGTSRSNPYYSNDYISFGNWDIRLSRYLRGEEAWKILESNWVNIPPESGREYVAVYLQVISRHTDGQPHEAYGCMLAELTGEENHLYGCVIGIDAPIEIFKTLQSGEMAEGWVVYDVKENEGNLMLAFDLTGHNGEEPDYRYLALEENSSIVIPNEARAIQPNRVGMEQADPASVSDTLIMKNWQFTITEVKRGEEAWQLIQPASEFNTPAGEGFEYALLKIRIERIGSEEKAIYLGFGLKFAGLDRAGQMIFSSSIKCPSPELAATLFPGGKDEGWVLVTVEKDNPEPVISVNDFSEFSPDGSTSRYIRLNP